MRIDRHPDGRLRLICEAGEFWPMHTLIVESGLEADCERTANPEGWVMQKSTYSVILELYNTYAQTALFGSEPKKPPPPASPPPPDQPCSGMKQVPVQPTMTMATQTVELVNCRHSQQTQTPILITSVSTQSHTELAKRKMTATKVPSVPNERPPTVVPNEHVVDRLSMVVPNEHVVDRRSMVVPNEHVATQPSIVPKEEHVANAPHNVPNEHMQAHSTEGHDVESTGSTYSGYDTLPNARLGSM